MGKLRIETRQLDVAGLGGHNYLALVDESGKIVDEIHGHNVNDALMYVRPKVPGKRALPNDPVVGPDKEPVRKTVYSEDSEAGIGRQDVFAAWKKMQDDAKRLSGKAQYGLLSPNSNSFWATVLGMSGYNYKDFEPDSPKWTPGTGININDPMWWTPPHRWPGVKVPDEPHRA